MENRIALIVGGGIGGLTTALALCRRGWAVHVLEAAPALEEVGAGLQLSPNAMKVIQALGLSAQIADVAFEPEALELRLGQSGRKVFSIPAGAAARRRWGAPYYHIHRADLLAVLEDALRQEALATISLGTQVISYNHEGDGAHVLLESGEPLAADLVIGADGIRSRIRKQMLGPDEPRFTGNMAWRMVVPIDQLTTPPPPTACVWAGRGRHAVTYRLRDGKLANLVGVVERADWVEEGWMQAGSREEALEDFAGWAPEITDIIQNADHHYRWALFDRAPLARWHDGAVALLGDACHPMLPFMAQGAAMAIEDAYTLAACLDGKRATSEALEQYEAQRKPRTSRVQAASRGNMRTFHRSNPLMRASTYGPMWLAGNLMPGFVQSRQDWIYSHDVTATDR